MPFLCVLFSEVAGIFFHLLVSITCAQTDRQAEADAEASIKKDQLLWPVDGLEKRSAGEGGWENGCPFAWKIFGPFLILFARLPVRL